MRPIDADALEKRFEHLETFGNEFVHKVTEEEKGMRIAYHLAKYETHVAPTIVNTGSLRPQWIPVTWHKTTPDDGIDAERYPIFLDCRMPEEGEEILVTNGIHVWLDVCDVYDGYGLESGSDWIDMTAWMPLPEPYEPEDVEQEV